MPKESPELGPTEKKITLNCGSAASGGGEAMYFLLKEPTILRLAVLQWGRPTRRTCAVGSQRIAWLPCPMEPWPSSEVRRPCTLHWPHCCWGAASAGDTFPSFPSFSPCITVWPRFTMQAMTPPPFRSLLLAAEWQDPTNNQSPADQCGLGHPIPHRCGLLQVQLWWQDFLHQGGKSREALKHSSASLWNLVLQGYVAHFVEHSAFSHVKLSSWSETFPMFHCLCFGTVFLRMSISVLSSCNCLLIKYLSITMTIISKNPCAPKKTFKMQLFHWIFLLPKYDLSLLPLLYPSLRNDRCIPN